MISNVSRVIFYSGLAETPEKKLLTQRVKELCEIALQKTGTLSSLSNYLNGSENKLISPLC